jgi:hypothetical protein
MVNLSFTEDELRFVSEVIVKHLQRKTEPSFIKTQFADKVLRKIKKGMRQNKHSPVWIPIISTVAKGIIEGAKERMKAQISKAVSGKKK